MRVNYTEGLTCVGKATGRAFSMDNTEMLSIAKDLNRVVADIIIEDRDRGFVVLSGNTLLNKKSILELHRRIFG